MKMVLNEKRKLQSEIFMKDTREHKISESGE